MWKISIIVRWLCALLTAAVAYVVVAIGTALVLRYFGSSSDTINDLSVMWGATAAVVAGTLVVPREHWKISAAVLAMLTMVLTLGLLGFAWSIGSVRTVHYSNVIYSAGGCLVGYVLLRQLFGRVVNRVAGYER
jgi:hypothetical protein